MDIGETTNHVKQISILDLREPASNLTGYVPYDTASTSKSPLHLLKKATTLAVRKMSLFNHIYIERERERERKKGTHMHTQRGQ